MLLPLLLLLPMLLLLQQAVCCAQITGLLTASPS
jgi:hypothetical protein